MSVPENAPLVRLRLAVLVDEAGEQGRHRAYAAELAARGWDVLLLIPARLPVDRAEVADDGVRVLRVPVTSPDQVRLWAAQGVTAESPTPRRGRRARLRLAVTKFAVEMRRAWRWNSVAAERTAALRAAYAPLLDAYAPDVIRADEEMCITVGRDAAGRAVAAGRSVLLVSATIGDVPEPQLLTELAETAVGARPAPPVRGRADTTGQAAAPAGPSSAPAATDPAAPADGAPADPTSADALSADMASADAPSDDAASDDGPSGRAGSAAAPSAALPLLGPLRPRAATTPRMLRIGPANMAGQGWAWGRAAERYIPDTRAEVVALERGGPLRFPADRFVLPEQTLQRPWQLAELVRIMDGATHLLAEGALPVLGRLHGPFTDADAPALVRQGFRLGVVLHGSDVRSPARHRELEAASPFTDAEDEMQVRLQRNADRVAERLADFPGPLFVSTPDLLDDVPDAHWLPVVVDTEVWTPGPPPLRRERPVVVHAPSNRRMKGTERIEPVVQRLHEAGRIEYRRVENAAPEEMPAIIRDADIVLDHFVIGNYSVLTCQAMAAGRITLCNVADRVRRRVPEDIPVVQATPDTLGDVLQEVLADRDAAAERAAAGPDFVRRLHDGRMSAAVLATGLFGLDAIPDGIERGTVEAVASAAGRPAADRT